MDQNSINRPPGEMAISVAYGPEAALVPPRPQQVMPSGPVPTSILTSTAASMSMPSQGMLTHTNAAMISNLHAPSPSSASTFASMSVSSQNIIGSMAPNMPPSSSSAAAQAQAHTQAITRVQMQAHAYAQAQSQTAPPGSMPLPIQTPMSLPVHPHHQVQAPDPVPDQVSYLSLSPSPVFTFHRYSLAKLIVLHC